VAAEFGATAGAGAVVGAATTGASALGGGALGAVEQAAPKLRIATIDPIRLNPDLVERGYMGDLPALFLDAPLIEPSLLTCSGALLNTPRPGERLG